MIAVQAGAARLLQERDPSASKQALSTIEDVAAETVSEIDRIVQSLRDQPTGGEVEPAPGLGALDTMVARHAAAGVPVRSTREGRPADAPTRRRPGRIPDRAGGADQRCPTRQRRRGRGIGFGAQRLRLKVTNPVAADAATRVNGGHGLVGMRERAALLGGELSAGRARDDYRVDVAIPYGTVGP